MSAPTVYLAVASSGGPESEYGFQGDHALLVPDDTAGVRRGGKTALTGKVVSDELRPPLLVSYAYVEKFVAKQARYRYRSWVLDSGAFTAAASGKPVDFDAYTTFARDRLAADPTLAEVFALDVIGDWRASVRNAERMWAAGVPAIPTYHVGSPAAVLVGLARDYPKLALGGMVGMKADAKRRFVEQAFARVWPKAVHGFGVGGREQVLAVPWHSVDASNWATGPCRFGRWRAFDDARMAIRGSSHDLRAEIAWYRRLEDEARVRWAREMGVLVAQLSAAGWRGYEEGR